MSVADEFPPEVYIPAQARRASRPSLSLVQSVPPVADPRAESAATSGYFIHPVVTPEGAIALQPPRALSRPGADTVRLTARGKLVLAIGALVAAAALLLTTHLSLGSAGHAPAVPAVVTVQSGDTLWSIASAVAPGADPRAAVDHLIALNHLRGVDLQPGQVLHTR